MSEYRAPVKDAMFALRHVAGLDELAKTERYAHADADTVENVLEEYGRFMQEVWAPTNAIGDKVGLTLTDDARVLLPEPLVGAYRKYVDAGWQGLNAEMEYGGAGFPEAVFTAAGEFQTSSNNALSMCPGLTTGAIEALQEWGSEAQKETYLRRLVTGEWTGTMNLTEPHAGSDVGLASTKAVPTEDGRWRITGTKIFISFGEHEMADNIIHLVLARTPDAPPGTKGISLFIVPKFLVNEDGSLGERNDVRVVSIEHKMGIHASPTCVLSFGDNGGAIGELVGEIGGGMRAMFTMMNSARLAVGTEGIGLAEAAYQKALSYAQERLQGKEIGGEGHGPVPIIKHADVRRMLMLMRTQIDAMRGLLLFNAAALDLSRALDGEDAERWGEVADLLTPISKGWSTDLAVELTSLAIQVYGGMGFIEESGVAVYFRDSRILPIYEGTNGIQAMDLVGRKLPMRMGGVINEFIARMRSIDAQLEAAGEQLTVVRTQLGSAIDALEDCVNWIFTNGLAAPVEALSGATAFLRLMGTVVGGYFSARLALAAHQELEAGSTDREYLEGKIVNARFYAVQVLPLVHGLVPAVKAGSADIMALTPEQLASV